MADNPNPNIFLSYSWSNADIADEIDKNFETIGIQFKRDIRDAEYRTSIKEFMQRIGQSDFVLMIISDEYLKSENCMYEVTELLNTHEFEKRILPIVLDNARNIFKPVKRSDYYDYWKAKLKEAENLRKKYSNQDYVENVKKINNINNCLDTFFQKIVDLNVSTYENLREDNYHALLKIIGFKKDLFLEEILGIRKLNDHEEQELALDAFLEKHPNNKYAYFEKATLSRNAGHWKKAKKYLEKVLSIDPKSTTGHNNLAALLGDKFADVNSAREHFEKAIELNPDYEAAHYNLARLFQERTSDYKLAREHYEKAIKINPNHSSAYYNMALLLKHQFLEFEKSRICFEQAIKINSKHAKAHSSLANLLVDKFSDFDKAKYHYAQAIKIDPNYYSPCYNLGLLLHEHFADYKGAKAMYKQAIKIDPGKANAHFNLALLLETDFFDYRNAKYHYGQVIKIDPTNAIAHNNLAVILQESFSDFNGARNHYEKAIRIDPDLEMAKENLASLLKNHFS